MSGLCGGITAENALSEHRLLHAIEPFLNLRE
jgi:hypothetical protein